MSSILFTLRDVQNFFSPSYLQRGRSYFREGRVAHLQISPGGETLSAQVQGSRAPPYKVAVRLSAGRYLQITGTCTCPVSYNCKHVAATLLAALEQNKQPDAQPKSDDLRLQHWLSNLHAAAPAQQDPAQDAPEHLLYLLSLQRFPAAVARLAVDFVVARRLQDGSYGKSSRFNGNYSSTARYIRPSDQSLLRWLHVLNPAASQRVLAGADGARLLAEMLATGRCHWQSENNPALRLGDARSAQIAWVAADNGEQRLQCLEAGQVDLVFPLAPPWYLDLSTQQCGPLQTGLDDTLAGTLLAAPPIAVGQVAAVREALQRHPSSARLPIPKAITLVQHAPVKPVIHLHLCSKRVPVHASSRWLVGASTQQIEMLRLDLDYLGQRLALGANNAPIRYLENDQLMELPRDVQIEKQVMDVLTQWRFVPVKNLPFIAFDDPDEAHYWAILPGQGPQLLMDFILSGVPVLRAAGWQVTFAADYPYRPVEDIGDWYGDIDEGVDNDWFGLELGLMVDGQRLNLLPILLKWLRELPDQYDLSRLQQLPANTQLIAYLDDGRVLPLPAERVAHILATLVDLYFTDLDSSGRLRLPRAQAAQLSALDSADMGQGWSWAGGEQMRAFGEKLRDFKGITAVATPPGLQTQLRPYQSQGLDWLQFLREYNLGGILADDMGLGKTIQALAHILVEKDSGRMNRPALVIAPTSLMVNWRMEAERFAPDLRVLTLQGLGRQQHFADMADYDLILSTYPLLLRDHKALLAQDYHLLILDEAQVIKNAKAKASQVVRQIKARHRLCLTGTPMENHLGELWSLFDFLMPGLLGQERQFRSLFRQPIEKLGDGERRKVLTRRIAPFLLRRSKQEVAKELPPKSEILRTVELANDQRDLYETLRLAMHEKVRQEIGKKGMARSQIVILDALLKLRQVCCDPRLVKLPIAKQVKQSAKLELLFELLPEMVEEGRRILLFSQFTSMLTLIEEKLVEYKLDYLKLTGQTQDRETPVRRFQNNEVPIFLISLKAGGTGLNLTAADTVIHYDPWWNPAVENQATDRAYRIGQDKPVFVYKLVTAGTVEDKILQMQVRKKALADSLFDENSKTGPAISAEDLNALFEPL